MRGGKKNVTMARRGTPFDGPLGLTHRPIRCARKRRVTGHELYPFKRRNEGHLQRRSLCHIQGHMRENSRSVPEPTVSRKRERERVKKQAIM